MTYLFLGKFALSENELNAVIKWCAELDIMSDTELKDFCDKYKIYDSRKLLNTLNACYCLDLLES